MSKKQDALDYHSTGRKGKIEVISSKPCLTVSGPFAGLFPRCCRTMSGNREKP